MIYKWNAKEYSRNSCNQQRWADGLLSRINFRGNEAVLDIGCGNGAITCGIRKKVPKGNILGIDNSTDMVALAKNVYGNKYKNLSFKKADACKLKFKNKFDIVFSNSSFHWIENHPALLRSTFRALCPDGKLVVQMGAKGNFCGILAVANKLMCRKKWRKYFANFKLPFHFFSPSAYRKMLKKYGFKINTIRTFADYMEYFTLAEFRNSLHSLWMPYMCKVPASMREEFLAETVSLYLKDYPPQKNGRIEVKMKRLEFQAQKPN